MGCGKSTQPYIICKLGLGITDSSILFPEHQVFTEGQSKNLKREISSGKISRYFRGHHSRVEPCILKMRMPFRHFWKLSYLCLLLFTLLFILLRFFCKSPVHKFSHCDSLSSSNILRSQSNSSLMINMRLYFLHSGKTDSLPTASFIDQPCVMDLQSSYLAFPRIISSVFILPLFSINDSVLLCSATILSADFLLFWDTGNERHR